MIYIIVLLYIFRLRVIGFPLSLWVGSKVGLENRDSNPTIYFSANFEAHNHFLSAGTFDFGLDLGSDFVRLLVKFPMLAVMDTTGF